jgi:hypothetical protein
MLSPGFNLLWGIGRDKIDRLVSRPSSAKAIKVW